MALPAHLVVGLGEALWDMLPTGKHLGGAPLNFAYIASLLGEHAIIASRIGNDSLGAEIQSELAGRNLDTSGIQTDLKLPTGTVEVRFRAGQPEYEIRQPVAWDALEWTPNWREIAAVSRRESAAPGATKDRVACDKALCREGCFDSRRRVSVHQSPLRPPPPFEVATSV